MGAHSGDNRRMSNAKSEEIIEALRVRLQSANQRLGEIPGPARAKLEGESDLLSDILSMMESRQGSKAYREARHNIRSVAAARKLASKQEKARGLH